MKRFIYRCPHCLPETVEQMTKDEFLREHPPKSVEVRSMGVLTILPLAKDLVVCDACDNEVEEEVFLISGHSTYCKLCATKYILPYCTDELIKRKEDKNV